MTTDKGEATLPQWRKSEGLCEWLKGKSNDELDIIEFGARAAYLIHIDRRNPRTGEREQVKVRVLATNHVDKCKARIDALRWCQTLAGLKERPNWAEACAIFGEVYVDELDTVCLVARLCRDHDAPEHQHQHYEALDQLYGRASIIALWERLCLLEDWTDPRISDMSDEEFWAAVTAIDRVKNSSPLVAIAGAERDSFVTSMATRLLSFRTRKSPSGSGETSTPAR